MTSRINTPAAFETGKSQAPNFMLSLLATCSSAVPPPGSEGEVALSDQLYNLLQDKGSMALDELNLLYNYRFGFSMSDALNFIGFNGKVKEFLDTQKRFRLNDGRVCLTTASDTGKHQTAHADLAVCEDYIKSTEDETASNTDTESTTDAESCRTNSNSDVDVTGWHSVGNRLVAALGSSRLHKDDVDALPWKALGGLGAAALYESDDEDMSPDVNEWNSVGVRVLSQLHSFHEIVDTA